MITQKAISLKIDTELLQELDAECSVRGRKRNSVINRAIGLYLRYADARRHYHAFDGDSHMQEELKEQFFSNEFLLAPSL